MPNTAHLQATRDGARIEIIRNPVDNQYEAVRDRVVIGVLAYRKPSETHLELDHTFVDPHARGLQVGQRLVEHLVAEVRASGGTLAPNCSFVAHYIDRHPELADLVAPSVGAPSIRLRERRRRSLVEATDDREPGTHSVHVEPQHIVASRVVLRPWDLDDTDVAFELITHPSVVRWMRPVLPEVKSRFDVREALSAWITQSYEAPFPQGRWAIERQDNGAVIGSIFLLNTTEAPPLLTLWWQLHPGAVGQGLATEAAHAVAHQALTVAGADAIYALIDPDNQSGIATARRLGMRDDGTTSEYFRTRLNRYRLDREDLEASQERRSLSITD